MLAIEGLERGTRQLGEIEAAATQPPEPRPLAAPDTERVPGPRVPVIPPNDGDWELTGIWPLKDHVSLYGLWPHMHLPGKDMTYVISYPDGREEIVLHVPKSDHHWQRREDF